MKLKSERAMFFKTWFAKPTEIGALLPSSLTLSRLMTSRIHPSRGAVVELGPGTGAFTGSILATGLPVDQLFLIEKHPPFVRHLQRRYPQVTVRQMDVLGIGKESDWLRSISPQAVISGLPLLNMGTRAQMTILKACFASMGSRGAFYQFTYHWRSPIKPRVLERLGLKAEVVGRVWQNIPPATVFQITRIEGSVRQAL